MDLKLQEIQTISNGMYKAIFLSAKGISESVTCHIVIHKGMTAVRFDPDIFMMNKPPRADSKEVVSAVLAHHRRQQISLG
jgi:hypothetical protein